MILPSTASPPLSLPRSESCPTPLEELDFAALTASRLAKISHDCGVDAATTLFYRCICRSSPHAEFIERLHAIDPRAAATSPPKGEILVAPGAFYQEHPRYGADGRAIHAVAHQRGISSRTLPARSTGSVSCNAEIIAEELARAPDRSILLVSLSKGGADVRIALERHPGIARKIRCWINIGGLLRGTPISDSLLGTRWWQARCPLRLSRLDPRAHPEFVRELSASPDSLLGSPIRIPQLPVINVLAFPLRQHLPGNSAVRHQRMAPFGPNDGFTLLRDAIIDHGFIYPIWSADHFLRTPELPRILHRLLAFTEQTL